MVNPTAIRYVSGSLSKNPAGDVAVVKPVGAVVCDFLLSY